MGDRTYCHGSIGGLIDAEGVKLLAAALDEDGAQPTGAAGEECLGADNWAECIEACATGHRNVSYCAEEVNYGEMNAVQAAVEKLGLDAVMRAGAGDTYAACVVFTVGGRIFQRFDTIEDDIVLSVAAAREAAITELAAKYNCWSPDGLHWMTSEEQERREAEAAKGTVWSADITLTGTVYVRAQTAMDATQLVLAAWELGETVSLDLNDEHVSGAPFDALPMNVPLLSPVASIFASKHLRFNKAE